MLFILNWYLFLLHSSQRKCSSSGSKEVENRRKHYGASLFYWETLCRPRWVVSKQVRRYISSGPLSILVLISLVICLMDSYNTRIIGNLMPIAIHCSMVEDFLLNKPVRLCNWFPVFFVLLKVLYLQIFSSNIYKQQN